MSKCEKINSKKYLTRDSPPYPANQCPNEIKKGNDGLNYQSKPDKNGVYKWILLDPNLPSEKPKKGRIIRISEELVYVATQDKDGKYYWKKIILKMKKNPDDYFRQFPDYEKPIYDYKKNLKVLPELKKELKKINIVLIFVKWSKDSLDGFDYEIAFELLDEKYPPNQQYIIITEGDIYHHSKIKNGYIPVMHSISLENKEKFNQIFMNFFPKRTTGLINFADSIKIYFEDQSKLTLKKDKEKIRFNVDLYFGNKKDNDINKILNVLLEKKKIPTKIGYVAEYDNVISGGRLNLYYHIFTDKIKEFEKYLKDLKNYIPNITKTEIFKLN